MARQRAAGGEPGAALAQVGEAQDRGGEVVVGGEFQRIDAGARVGVADLGLAGARRLLEAAAEPPVVGVDEELLAGLGVLDQHHAEVGQRPLERVDDAHRDRLVAHRQAPERLRPARLADEVGDDEHQRAPRHDPQRGFDQLGEPCSGRARSRRAVVQPIDQREHLAASAARRQHGVDAVAVEQRADAVAVPCQEARQHGDEVGGDRVLAHVAGAEVDRRRQVDEEPGGDLAVLGVLAHVRRLQPRGHVPVDVADGVVVLVLAQVGEIEPETAEQRPVIAVQQAVEPADHRPLEAPQQRLGVVPPLRRRRFRCRFLHVSATWVSSGLSGAGILRRISRTIESADTPSASAS